MLQSISQVWTILLICLNWFGFRVEPVFATAQAVSKNYGHFKSGQNTVKLGYNDHGYNEFTAVTHKNYRHFWSHLATFLHKSSRL